MGGSTYSGKVTTSERVERKNRNTKPKFTGVLTEQMVDRVLTSNINNVSENKNADVREVVKKVVSILNRPYSGSPFQAKGKFVELDGKRIEIRKGKNGIFDALD